MHRHTRIALATVLLGAALGLAACGSSAVPTVPPPSGVPPAGDPTPVVAVDPTPIDPTPVGGSEAPGVVIKAVGVDFDPKVVTVPANVPLTLVLDNQDAAIPHDIQVSDANGNIVVRSEIITGPAQLQVALPALAPGVYPFVCVVHPNMVGTITAE